MLFKYKLLTIEKDGSDGHEYYGIVAAEYPEDAMQIIQNYIVKNSERYYSATITALSNNCFKDISENTYTYL